MADNDIVRALHERLRKTIDPHSTIDPKEHIRAVSRLLAHSPARAYHLLRDRPEGHRKR